MVDLPYCQADNTARGVRGCGPTDRPRFRLPYDTCRLQIMEVDIYPTIRDRIRRIGHFRVAVAGNAFPPRLVP